jgi:hypothetical protein
MFFQNIFQMHLLEQQARKQPKTLKNDKSSVKSPTDMLPVELVSKRPKRARAKLISYSFSFFTHKRLSSADAPQTPE